MSTSLKASVIAVAISAVIAFGMAPSAKAAVVNINPGDNNILVYGDIFRTQSEEQAPGASFSDSFFFSLPDQADPTGTEKVFYSYDVSFPVPTGAAAGIGIRNLTFTLTDATNNTILNVTTLTNANGFALPGFQNGHNFTGTWPAPIELILTVTGTALSQGGSYEATIAASLQPIPLPAPLVLFISALLGLGFLGRIRQAA